MISKLIENTNYNLLINYNCKILNKLYNNNQDQINRYN